MTFRELLALVQKGVLDLYTHRAPPFDQVVNVVHPERNLSYTPLFQVMINWRDRDQQLSFIGMEGLVVKSLLAETRTSKFDLTMMLTDDESEIWLEMEYNTDLFDAARIERMVGHYQTLLEGIVANPEKPLADLPLLTDVERQQLLVEWNQTDAIYPKNRCLHELVEAQVKRTPDAVAVVFENERLTYRELNERAGQLAVYLQKLGVGHGTMVGICVDRSLDMIVGLLGILKAGGAYVPMDPSYPQERVAFMIEDAKPKVLLTHQRWLESLPKQGTQTVLLDTDWPKIKAEAGAGVPGNPTSECPAYVIFTSGSTGKPKGVQIPHRAVVNFLQSMQLKLEFKPQEVLLAVTTLSFDIAGLEIFLPLTTGAQIALVSREVASDGALLSAELKRRSATIMQATPATWRLLLEAGWNGSPHFKILCGGEAWSTELGNELLQRCGALWNMYGPTETTIWSAASKVQAGQPILIGPPIANTQFYILDAAMQPVPLGIPGELWIGGDGLAIGYLNRPELSAERFVPDPFSKKPGARLYRTGDSVRMRADRQIEFLNRIDNQVKLRGFRIELGEIEAQLKLHPAIREIVVIVREDTAGDKRIVAYLTSKNGEPPKTAELRGLLQTKLPDYMIPSAFVTLDQLPLTPNGKVDRKALPKPELAAAASGFVPPTTPDEIALATIWCEVLGLKQVGIHDNFFDLGGHSLVAMRLHARIEKELGKRMPLAALFQAPTIAQLQGFLTKSDVQRQHIFDLSPDAVTDSPIVFCFHFVFMARALARHLGKSGRVFAIISRIEEEYDSWQKTGKTTASLKDLAKDCVDDLQRVQPHGPYYLTGFCFGGNLAAEVAGQLSRKGEQVAMLALLNSYNHAALKPQKGSVWHWRLRRFVHHVKQGTIHGWPYVSVKLHHWLSNRKSYRPRIGINPLPDKEVNDTDENRVIQSDFTRRLLRSHTAQPFAAKAVLFRAIADIFPHEWKYDPNHGWKNVILGDLILDDVICRHADLMGESHIVKIADKISSSFRSQQHRMV